jgi:hypothetical protein
LGQVPFIKTWDHPIFLSEYFFEKYAIRKLRYFSSKFNWKFETKYAGSQCEINLYDVRILIANDEWLTLRRSREIHWFQREDVKFQPNVTIDFNVRVNVRFPTENFFEKYAIRKLRYFSSKFDWKFETKYAGSQCEIDLYDVHPLLKTPESWTSYILKGEKELGGRSHL